jgi:hypothetical protein
MRDSRAPLVGARPRHHRDGQTGSVAHGGVEIGRLDPHLLDHVRVRRRGELTVLAVVGRAVDGVFGASRAADHPCLARRPADESLRRERHLSVGVDAGHRARQQDRHVRLHRQVLHQPLFEAQAGAHRAGVEQRRVGGDLDAFGDGADVERELQRDLLPDRERDAALRERLVPRHLDRDLVAARVEQRRFEVAATVGRQPLADAGLDVRDGNRRSGDHARSVAHRAGDVAPRFLRRRRDRRQQQQSSDHPQARMQMFHDALLQAGRQLVAKSGKGEREFSSPQLAAAVVEEG